MQESIVIGEQRFNNLAIIEKGSLNHSKRTAILDEPE